MSEQEKLPEQGVSALPQTNCGRRQMVFATAAVAGLGGLVGIVPFVASMLPSERARAAGAPVEIDISKLEPGQMITVEWQGKPVWVLNRSQAMLDSIRQYDTAVADPKSELAQPDYQPPEDINVQTRSIKPDLLVVVGICTHLGCSPTNKFKSGAEEGMPTDWLGGWLCPCHGSTFDFAGRVFKNKPAPENLYVPPYHYLSETRILVGKNKET